ESARAWLNAFGARNTTAVQKRINASSVHWSYPGSVEGERLSWSSLRQHPGRDTEVAAPWSIVDPSLKRLVKRRPS
ncbi:MAG TPA: hypothetical protein VHJ58_12375, partial [Vicinamibacterales bacterium]|nr:hypothetical protein [Vicinamibacterales bacterium]